MIAHVEPDKQPYIMELVHTVFDHEDPCPVYDFHISVKPIHYVSHENLYCMGNPPPPAHIQVTHAADKFDYQCSFTDEMLTQNADPETGIIDYDVMIELPHSDYFIDIELRSDFLTGNYRMYLFMFDDDSSSWIKIAQSYFFDEHSYEDMSLDASQELSSTKGDKSQVLKLRFLEDVPPELTDKASQLMLRIKVNPMHIMDTLAQYGLFDAHHDSLCFNFELSTFFDEIGGEGHHGGSDNALVRVDWQGVEQSY